MGGRCWLSGFFVCYYRSETAIEKRAFGLGLGVRLPGSDRWHRRWERFGGIKAGKTTRKLQMGEKVAVESISGDASSLQKRTFY